MKVSVAIYCYRIFMVENTLSMTSHTNIDINIPVINNENEYSFDLNQTPTISENGENPSESVSSMMTSSVSTLHDSTMNPPGNFI